MPEQQADRERQESKNSVESEDLPLRPSRKSVSGIRKQYVHLALVLLVAVVAVALIVGLGIDFHPRLDHGKHEIDLPPRQTQPAELAELPDNYAQIPQPPKPHTKPLATNGGKKGDSGLPPALEKQNAKLRRNLASMMAAIEQIDAKNKHLLKEISKYQGQARKAQVQAWQSPLLFKINDSTDKRRKHSAQASSAQLHGEGSTASLPHPSKSQPSQQLQINQQHKLMFLRNSTAPAAYLDKPYLRPLSSYEVQAGTVIPAALLTGINTDLPGMVIAVTTAPVYDTMTGKHLLIPQGARLLGSYDSEIDNGQNRALLVWHRLIMPNGRSIALNHMPATDAAGYAGVADKVDYHADKLAMGAALSSIIAYAGNLARGHTSNSEESLSGSDVIGDTVAQQAARVGSKVMDRQLNVQPTITIRPGWPVRVLVNKDMLLAPYEPR